MTDQVRGTRRWKLESEMTSEERARARTFGVGIERPEYAALRKKALRAGEGDNTEGYITHLREEAEVLSQRAMERNSAVVDAMTPAEHEAQMLGGDPLPKPGAALQELAEEYASEAAALEQYLAERPAA